MVGVGSSTTIHRGLPDGSGPIGRALLRCTLRSGGRDGQSLRGTAAYRSRRGLHQTCTRVCPTGRSGWRCQCRGNADAGQCGRTGCFRCRMCDVSYGRSAGITRATDGPRGPALPRRVWRRRAEGRCPYRPMGQNPGKGTLPAARARHRTMGRDAGAGAVRRSARRGGEVRVVARRGSVPSECARVGE
jgi:hypothetical protein